MTSATWIVAILCALAVIAGALGGPSDTEAAADTAADLRDAQQQARRRVARGTQTRPGAGDAGGQWAQVIKRGKP